MGHAIQYLFKCWSFWLVQEQLYGPVDRVVVDAIHRRTHWHGTWQQELMHAMGARFVDPSAAPSDCRSEWSVVARELTAGWGDSFFLKPVHAERLVSLFRLRVEPLQQIGTLSLGVINRLDSRGWPDAQRLVSILKRAPHSSAWSALSSIIGRAVEWVNDNLTLIEQISAVRGHQLLISPHGAQNSNWAFAAPCTTALEIMPASFIIMEYQQLLLDVGGRAFFLYHGSQTMVENLEATARIMKADIALQYYARVSSRVERLEAETVLNTLGTLINAREQCLAGESTQNIPFDGVPTLGGLAMYLAKYKLANGTANLGYCYRCGGPVPCCVGHGNAYDCRDCLPPL